jgi:hypothetical protein
VSQTTEASEASSANVQLQTELNCQQTSNIQLQPEHADGQLNLTTSTNRQIELANGHTKKHIEPAKRQIEHANGQIEHNNKHMSIFVKWKFKWQKEQAKKQIEHANRQNESLDWPNNLIDIIKKVRNVPWKTPQPPEFIFLLSKAAAVHNREILKQYNNNLGKALKANENTPLGYGSEFQMPQELQKAFSLHPLWLQMESILRNGNKWLL